MFDICGSHKVLHAIESNYISFNRLQALLFSDFVKFTSSNCASVLTRLSFTCVPHVWLNQVRVRGPRDQARMVVRYLHHNEPRLRWPYRAAGQPQVHVPAHLYGGAGLDAHR